MSEQIGRGRFHTGNLAVHAQAACAQIRWWHVAVLAALTRGWVTFVVHPPARFLYSDMQQYTYNASALQWHTPDHWLAFRPVLPSLILQLADRIHLPPVTTFAILQWLLLSLAVGLVPLLARRLGATAGWSGAAGLAAAIYPPAVSQAGWVLTEGLSTTLLTTLVLLTAAALQSPTRRSIYLAIGAGFVGALALSTRPNLVLATIGAGIVLLARRGPRHPVFLAMLASTAALAVLPLAHVAFHDGRPGLATNGGLNFFLNFAPIARIKYISRGVQLGVFEPAVNHYRFTATFVTSIDFTDQATYYRMGLSRIAEAPAFAAGRVLQNLWELTGLGILTPFPEWAGAQRTMAWSRRAFGLLVFLPLCIAALLALVRAKLRNAVFGAERAIAWATLPSFIVAGALYMGTLRTREPFDLVLFALFAAVVPRLPGTLGPKVRATSGG